MLVLFDFGVIYIKPYAERFYKSTAWNKCRDGFLISKYYICEICGDTATIVHHIIYLTPENINDPDISLNWENLEALCQDCHNKEHMGKYSATRDDVMFDSEGNLIQVLKDM